MLWNCFLDFAVEHWFGCCATEPGFARDIGAMEVWLIDCLIDWLIIWSPFSPMQEYTVTLLLQSFRYGWANFRNIASLVSGVGIFFVGAGFSFYHGIMGLMHPEQLGSLVWVNNYAVIISHSMPLLCSVLWLSWNDCYEMVVFLCCRVNFFL